MSMTARHESRKTRQLCQRCRDRKARFAYHGQVRADRNHTLCFECFRSERERQRAQRLSGLDLAMLRAPTGGRPLTARQVEHRRRMLLHLASTV